MLLQYVQDGGPVMWPIIGLGAVAALLVLERTFWWVRHALRRDPALRRSILDGSPGPRPPVTPDPVAEVVHGFRADPERGRLMAEQLAASSRRGTSVLRTLASLSTSLGLFGTVVGVSLCLDTMAAGRPADVAHRLSVSLYTTVAGLIVYLGCHAALAVFTQLSEALQGVLDLASKAPRVPVAAPVMAPARASQLMPLRPQVVMIQAAGGPPVECVVHRHPIPVPRMRLRRRKHAAANADASLVLAMRNMAVFTACVMVSMCLHAALFYLAMRVHFSSPSNAPDPKNGSFIASIRDALSLSDTSRVEPKPEPEPPKPEPPKPEPPKPEPPKPEPEPPKPEPPKPEPPKPEPPKPEAKENPPKVEPPKPETEAPMPGPKKSETPNPPEPAPVPEAAKIEKPEPPPKEEPPPVARSEPKKTEGAPKPAEPPPKFSEKPGPADPAPPGPADEKPPPEKPRIGLGGSPPPPADPDVDAKGRVASLNGYRRFLKSEMKPGSGEGAYIPKLRFGDNTADENRAIMKYFGMELIAYPKNMKFYVYIDPDQNLYSRSSEFDYIRNFSNRVIYRGSPYFDGLRKEAARRNGLNADDLVVAQLLKPSSAGYIAWKEAETARRAGLKLEEVDLCEATFVKTTFGVWIVRIDALVLRDGRSVAVQDFEADRVATTTNGGGR